MKTAILSTAPEIAQSLKGICSIQGANDETQIFDWADHESFKQLKDNSFNVIITYSSVEKITKHILMDAWRIIVPGGELFLIFFDPIEQINFDNSILTLSGFVHSLNSTWKGFYRIHCKKPEYKTGISRPINIENKKVDIWNSSLNSDNLINEDDLLDESDFKKPEIESSDPQDCGDRNTRKACKNCTCSRARKEANQKPKISLAMLENPSVNSSCGSCGLGDAFRCDGCPYRGLPAFRPGERIVLPDDFDYDLIET